MRVYLDNAATTQTDPKVEEAMKPYFTRVFGNPSSLHEFGKEAKEALEKSRKTIAGSINADPDEIVFTSGGSESNNLAVKGVAYQNKNKGNKIITSSIEHPSVLETCRRLKMQGFDISYLKVDNEGFVDLKQLEKEIDTKTILVSIIHGNNEIGAIQGIDKIASLCKKHKVLFHTDAVQSFTKVAIDVRKTKADLISFSSHKIHGPKGVGALYVRKGTRLHKQICGGHQEKDIRAGTENVAGIVGFAKAVQIANNTHIKHMEKLRDYMITEVSKKIKHTKLNGPEDNRLCNNINISFKFIEGESLLYHLDSKGIAVSTGSACSSQSLRPSHVLTAIGLPHKIAHGSIRFSLSRHTTKQEIDYTIKKLVEVVNSLREMSPLTGD